MSDVRTDMTATAVNEAVTSFKNEGDIKCIGGSFKDMLGIAGIYGLNNTQAISKATNIGNIICAANVEDATKCYVGGITAAINSGIAIDNSKSYGRIASFTWNGTKNGVVTNNTSNVGMISSAAYDASKILNCQIGGSWYKSATVVTNENGELELDITYDDVTSSNFFKYISASSNPTSAPGDSVCKYWDGK